MDSAWEKIVITAQFGILDPVTDSVSRGLSDFKLNWLRGLLLHDDGPSSHAITMTNVTHSQFYKITCPELTIQPQVKQRQLSRPMCQLEPYANSPNLLELEG